jgi:hypothetical protein
MHPRAWRVLTHCRPALPSLPPPRLPPPTTPPLSPPPPRQGEEVAHNINFIKIDCTQLKASLAAHCVQWQGKLTSLLNANAVTDLRALHELFGSAGARLRQPPTTLGQLSDSFNLLEQVKRADLPAAEEKFGPLEEASRLFAWRSNVSSDSACADVDQGLVVGHMPACVRVCPVVALDGRSADFFTPLSVAFQYAAPPAPRFHSHRCAPPRLHNRHPSFHRPDNTSHLPTTNKNTRARRPDVRAAQQV